MRMMFGRTAIVAAAVAAAFTVAPAAAAPDGGIQLVQWGNNNRQQGELTLRINRLEDQIRQLNGQIEQLTHATQCGANGGDLEHDVHAVPVVFDHALDACHLAFDPTQSGVDLLLTSLVEH